MRTYDFSEEGDVKLSRLIDGAGLASSRAEAERLIKQGAVEWDGQKILDAGYLISTATSGEHILRVGKKPAIVVRIGMKHS